MQRRIPRWNDRGINADAVADGELIDTVTYSVDHARAVRANHMRKVQFQSLPAGAYPQVQSIERRRLDIDADFAGSWLGNRQIFTVLDNLRAPVRF